MTRARMYRPDYDLKGPYLPRRRVSRAARNAIDFVVTVAVIWAMSFTFGALGRNLGWL